MIHLETSPAASTGTVHFSSSDIQAGLPASDYTFANSDHGVHVFTNSVTLKTVGAGSQTVTVSDAANGLSNSAGVNVNSRHWPAA